MTSEGEQNEKAREKKSERREKERLVTNDEKQLVVGKTGREEINANNERDEVSSNALSSWLIVCSREFRYAAKPKISSRSKFSKLVRRRELSSRKLSDGHASFEINSCWERRLRAKKSPPDEME